MQSAQTKLFTRIGCLAPVIGIAALIYLLNREAYLLAYSLFTVFFLFALISYTLATKAENKEIEKQREFLETFTPDKKYNATHSFTGYDLMSKIAVDESNRTLYFWMPYSKTGEKIKKAYPGMEYKVASYKFRDLLAVEYYENGILQKGAISENEGAGERIKALGQSVEHPEETTFVRARKLLHRKISTAEMKLIFDNEDRPVQIVRFYYNVDKRLRRDSAHFQKVLQDVDHYFSLLSFILESERQYMEE